MFTQPSVFLSSRIVGLSKLRQDIYEWSVQNGYKVWVAEHCSSVEADTPYSVVQDICLKEVRNTDLFLWVLHQGYGDTATYDPSELSLLELEIFQAMLAHKPIVILRLQPFNSDPRLESLLRILQISVPIGLRDFTSEIQIKDYIKKIIRDVSDLSLKHPFRVIQRFVTALGFSRHPIGQDGNFDLEMRFLDNQNVPRFLESSVDTELIEKLINDAKQVDSYQDKLIYTWKAIRHLYAVPFHEGKNPDFWPYWSTVLASWASSAAWCGLHGHLLTGRLSATNSLYDLYKIFHINEGTKNSYTRMLSTHGAIASEYYSIAKLVRSHRLRHSFLHTALAHLDTAESVVNHQPNADVSGFLSIRGSVLRELGDLRGTVQTYRRVLETRQAQGTNPIQIAETKVDLGFALMRIGHLREAGRLLEDGVNDIEKAQRGGFVIRAKKKMALYYLSVGALRDAYKQTLETEALSKYYGAEGQVSTPFRILKNLRRYFPFQELEAEVNLEGGTAISIAIIENLLNRIINTKLAGGSVSLFSE